jgi:hypothetical protein|tara:strand:+ start:345 stop:530 length:186 start_codon:yes stop_codon:yes gene_type:complete
VAAAELEAADIAEEQVAQAAEKQEIIRALEELEQQAQCRVEMAGLIVTLERAAQAAAAQVL